MQKTSPTYQIDRNQKIYEEYISTNQSYFDLAKKYDLTPQRIQAIVASIQEKGLDKKLKVTDSSEQRESFKQTAVGLREQGRLEISLGMFNQILEWDVANNNTAGQIDVLGHLRLTYTLLADNEKEYTKVIEYRKLAVSKVEESLKLIEQNFTDDKGKSAIAQIHYSSALFQLAKSEKKVSTDLLEKALKAIDEAIKNLPGSQAHKAWPSFMKARIQNELNKPFDALDTIAQAEKWLFEGYEEEIGKDDQAELKILVWKSGLDLARAEIYQKHKKEILTKYSLESIIGQSDPKKHLTLRKAEARGKMGG